MTNPEARLEPEKALAEAMPADRYMRTPQGIARDQARWLAEHGLTVAPVRDRKGNKRMTTRLDITTQKDIRNEIELRRDGALASQQTWALDAYASLLSWLDEPINEPLDVLLVPDPESLRLALGYAAQMQNIEDVFVDPQYVYRYLMALAGDEEARALIGLSFFDERPVTGFEKRVRDAD